jgi:hypothetical protein
VEDLRQRDLPGCRPSDGTRATSMPERPCRQNPPELRNSAGQSPTVSRL